ncbi:lasso peptide biosynthesis B2 protein [Devosia sp. SL43]|nr:lasso peptide biosynthesis B2 protein [Devosia sp. SL43]UJW87446.1 lasso peptide biosynthesis B2 protein [Devosia sp. SL43]
MLVETALLLIRVRLALTFSSLTEIQQRMLPDTDLPAQMPPASLARMAWCVHNTARLVPQASCLTQGLVLQKLLHRRGVASELKLGVRRDAPDDLAAHAWVLVDDIVVLGGTARDLEPFSPIAKFSTGLK